MKRERLCHTNGVHNNNDQGCNILPKMTNQNNPEASSSSKVNEETESKLTNDELLYDPEADEEDQKWIDNKRSTSLVGLGKPPKSDAVLNCPCCMTMLCLDCQRHEIYKTQFRAMLVFNCNVDFKEKLQYKTKKKRRKTFNTATNISQIDNYYPVKCSICDTQVAVYDHDEVYHFFNVLSSYT